MANAKQLPSGSWRVQVYAGKDAQGKKQYRSFTRLTKKEAEYEALQWQLHYKEVSRDTTAMTLDEAGARTGSCRRPPCAAMISCAGPHSLASCRFR